MYVLSQSMQSSAHTGAERVALGLFLLLLWLVPGHSWAASACPPGASLRTVPVSAEDTLVRVSAPHRKAVILIGGIDDNYQYFSPWIRDLTQAGNVVFGFNHNHRLESMTDASRHLEAQMETLADEGFDDVAVLAHSMGGLVARKAIDIAVQRGCARRFERLELHAFGTPWGGFAIANLARVLPLGESISRWIGVPMALEIGSTSAFMESLSMPWPGNLRLYVYLGSEDTVARPDKASEKKRYQANTENAQVMPSLEGVTHDSYASLPVLELENGAGGGTFFRFGVPRPGA